MTMTDTPLFLDVDGVLNAVPHNNHAGEWDDFETLPVDNGPFTYQLTISRKCCDALVGLPVDIQWLTTWGALANTELAHMTGFDEFPVLAEMSFRDRGNWKRSAIDKWYFSDEGSRRFIWIDDDAIPPTAEKSFPDALLIRPELDTGITPDHIEAIRQYCEQDA